MSEIPARPTATKEIIMAAAIIMAEKLDGADAATIAKHFCPGMDGYDLAKELEKQGYWDISRDEMEMLDEMDHLVGKAVREAERQWLADNKIQPLIPIGSHVRCLSRGQIGVITGISQHAAACYEIKPEGQDDAASGNRRWICRFESVELAN